MAGMFNNAPDIIAAVKRAIAENADLHKEVESYMQERVKSMVETLIARAETVNGIKLVTLGGVRVPDMVKNVAFGVRAASPEATAFIAATVDMAGKPLLTVMLTDDVVKQGHNASQMVREAAKKIQGGGGGQPGFAQAGGKNKDGISEAFEALIAMIKN